MEFESRTYTGEVRATDNDTIEGLGIVFNVVTDLGWFKEKIDPGAWTDEVAAGDIRSFFNHDANYVLGRTLSNTLELEKIEEGVYYRVLRASETDTGRNVGQSVKRGDVTGSSFQFRVLKDQWELLEDGTELRTILKFKEVREIGPVVFPAYTDTTAAKRSHDDYKAEFEKHKKEQEQRHDDPHDDLGYSYRERHLRLIRGK